MENGHPAHACTLPAVPLLTSRELGWTTADVGMYADPPVCDDYRVEFAKPMIHVALSGRYDRGTRHRGRWQVVDRVPGSICVAPPGEFGRMRWRSTSDVPMRSLHVHLDPVATGGRPIGLAMGVRDPFLSAGVRALEQALRAGGPALYADSVARTLAVHLAWGPRSPAGQRMPRLSEQQVDQLTDYMRARLADNVTVDDLAGVVGVSRFHFIRVFSATTGQTPYQYLRRIRMAAAADLLRGTAQPIAQVALACGYRSPGQFAAAFRREYGVSPTDYRG
ncbi:MULTISPECIES: AraC family transcriptional regulator [Catenuloplanes]|uniref:AraC family transcriptional regulator n=1 Tax=Catenuloplanes niger TaxID=587534 RepID=A0AAE3ZL40_9ACTN|nr:AraC family transcriptional regulator [Catenuloplanes niger]MDR7320615.1 AraC family transcriptional regulator [Catenuloplanes niger]